MKKIKEYTHNPGNTAICYYRYSSAAQRDVSIEQQREEAHKFAKAHNYHIIKEYEDHAMSGTSDDRPQFQQMLYEVKSLRPAYLILWKSDRLARNRTDAIIAKNHLRKCGVRWEYVAQQTPDDDDPNSIILESLMEAMDEAYSLNLRRNVLRGLSSNAEKALYNGIKVLGYKGKQNEKYMIDEDTEPVVRRIFMEYANGKPLKQICDGLTEAGIKSVKGNDFTINSIRHILTNRAYIGEYRWGDTVIEDGMPRIINDELFEKVQARLEANKRGGKAALKKVVPEAEIADYWLSNHIFCAKCNGSLQGVSGTGKSGRLFYYYSCKNHRRHKCSLKNQRKDLIETMVSYVLDDLLRDEAFRIMVAEKCFEYYKEQYDDNGAFEKSLKTKIKEVNKKLANIMKAVEMGVVNETTQQRMQELELQRSLLADELLVEQQRKKYDLKLKNIVAWLEHFFGTTEKEKNREKVLELLVDKIYIDGDKLTVTLHYTGDRRELPYKETMDLIDGRRRINEELDGNIPEVTPELEETAKSLLDDGGGGSDFFQ